MVFLTANASRVPDDLTDAVGIVAKPYTSSGMMSVLRFLEEGMRQPPPRSAPPSGLALSAKYASVWVPEGATNPSPTATDIPTNGLSKS